MTQIEFAQLVAARLGHAWHQTRLSKLELGEGEITLPELAACADVANVSIAWLGYSIEVADDGEARAAWLSRYRISQSAKE